MNSTDHTFDVASVRQDFPILDQEVNGNPLIYFDNAATSQKPKVVIEALDRYYRKNNANIHRGAHYLAAKSTGDYEDTREAIRRFLNAKQNEEIIFTRGVTEAINLLAATWGRQNIGKDDEILLSTMEHHSNIVPWQLLAEEKGAKIKVIPINEKGEIRLEEYKKMLSPRTKLLAVVHVSNALGTINPVEEMIPLAHEVGAKVMLDGAQAAVHLDIDVQALNCDFYAFSGHKVYAPTGIGALYGKLELLQSMPPYHGGGEMIKDVSFERSTYSEPPHKFEAGTPNIGDAIAFKYALEYIEKYGKSNIAAHEDALTRYATEKMQAIEGLRIIGEAERKVSVISFVVEGVHHGDLGTLLDNYGVAIRTGHHCTQPLMKHYEIPGTSRVSFALYNTFEEIDRFIEALQKSIKMLC